MIRPWACLLVLLASLAEADEAYITNQTSEDLSIVSLTDRQVVATVPIGGKPAGVAVAPLRAEVYVTSPEGPYVSVVDTRSRTVTRQIPVEGGPLGIAVNPISGMIYVADWYESRLFVIAPTGGIEATLKTGTSPSGVAVTPDGTRILTADRDDNQISIFDAKTLVRLATVPVGERPFGVTIDAAGAFAYTANVASNDVTVVNLATMQPVATIGVGERPYAIGLTKSLGFSTDQYAETVTVFDLATRRQVKTIDVGEYPEGIAVSEDAATVYVANWFSNMISVIDVETLTVKGEIVVGDGPRAFGAFLSGPAQGR